MIPIVYENNRNKKRNFKVLVTVAYFINVLVVAAALLFDWFPAISYALMVVGWTGGYLFHTMQKVYQK